MAGPRADSRIQKGSPLSQKNETLRRRVRRGSVAALAPLALALPLAGCGSSTSLDSSDAHNKLTKQLQGVPGISTNQANQIADCAIQEFKGQGYKTYDDVPKAKATAAGQDCAQKILIRRGVGSRSKGGSSSAATPPGQ